MQQQQLNYTNTCTYICIYIPFFIRHAILNSNCLPRISVYFMEQPHALPYSRTTNADLDSRPSSRAELPKIRANCIDFDIYGLGKAVHSHPPMHAYAERGRERPNVCVPLAYSMRIRMSPGPTLRIRNLRASTSKQVKLG